MVINNNAEISNTEDRDLHVCSNATLVVRGITNGKLIIEANAVLDMRGISNGEIVVKDDAIANIRGIHNGALATESNGKAFVWGVLAITPRENSDIILYPGSVVAGRKY